MSKTKIDVQYGFTVRQPWASLYLLGVKKDEVRKRRTNIRGWIALHACATLHPYEKSVCSREPVVSALEKAGLFDPQARIGSRPDFSRLPVGVIIAVMRIIDCVDVNSHPKTAWLERQLDEDITDQYAYLLADITPLPVPIHCDGALGFWKLSPAIRRKLNSLL